LKKIIFNDVLYKIYKIDASLAAAFPPPGGSRAKELQKPTMSKIGWGKRVWVLRRL
jgi:hypothetical protein